MNTEKILQLVDFLETVPENFDMHHFVQTAEGAVSLENAHHCGTKLCVAGWACVFNGESVRVRETTMYMLPMEVPVARRAQKILGLTENEAHAMFYPGAQEHIGMYPNPNLCNLYDMNNTQVVACIREFVRRKDPVGYEAYYNPTIPTLDEEEVYVAEREAVSTR